MAELAVSSEKSVGDVVLQPEHSQEKWAATQSSEFGTSCLHPVGFCFCPHSFLASCCSYSMLLPIKTHVIRLRRRIFCASPILLLRFCTAALTAALDLSVQTAPC